MEFTKKTKLTPFGSRFLVKPVATSDRLGSGILVKPETAKDKPIVGTVVAIGDGFQDTNYVGKWPPQGIKIGTKVLFGRFAGEEIRLEDGLEKDWPRLIGVEEIKAIIEEG